MTHLLIRLAQYFRSHQLVCWLSMVALFAFFGYFATQIHLEEDINKLMPSSKNEDGTTKLAFADLKIKDKVFLLFEGEHADSLAETCDAFVESLTRSDSASQTIGDVFYRLDEDLMPDAIDYMAEHIPAYIDTSAYARFDLAHPRAFRTSDATEPRRPDGRVWQHVPGTHPDGPDGHA